MVTFEYVGLYYRCAFLKSTNPDVYNEYYEGSYHRPIWKLGGSVAPQLNAAYRTTGFYNVTPKKGREYSEMEIPVPYENFEALSSTNMMPKFIGINARMGTYPIHIFGWIDSAEPVATKGPNQNTLIRWHVDYWLTISAYNYLRNANPAQYGQRYFVTYANGRVKRGPESMARPDPSSPRLWKFGSKTSMVRKLSGGMNDTDGPYAIVLFTTAVAGPNNTSYTRLHIAFWGLNQTQIQPNVDKIPVQRIYDGLLEEIMDLPPSSIVGVWFSPVPPCDYNSATIKTHTFDNHPYGWYQYDAGSVPPTTYHYTFTNPIKTTDNEKYLVVDPLGSVYGTLPWGLEADRMVLAVDVGTSGAWLDVDFKNGATSDEWGEGRKMQIPLISAPVTSNALSDYVYSGQQDYDKDIAKMQQEQNLKSGIAGLGTSLIGGAVGGAMAGGLAGAAAGAAAGPLLGGIGVAANYFIQQETDQKSQRLAETLLSNQISNVIISGGGSNWYWTYLGKWYLVRMDRDSVSSAELAAEHTELGYVCDAFTTNAGLLIAAGGPLRIEGLQVDGDITPEGRRYIQALFARGVHLDLIQ